MGGKIAHPTPTRAWPSPVKREGMLLGRRRIELQMMHGPTAQPVIREDECHHRFCDRHGTRAKTRVMTSMHFEVNRYTVLSHRTL